MYIFYYHCGPANIRSSKTIIYAEVKRIILYNEFIKLQVVYSFQIAIYQTFLPAVGLIISYLVESLPV